MKAWWRFQGKLILLFLGMLILLSILVYEWRKKGKGPIEEFYEIEDSWLKNVYITSSKEDGVTYFLGQEEHFLKTGLGRPEYMEKIADIHIVKDQVVEIVIKNNRINGRLIRVGKEELELEEEGIFSYGEDLNVYQLYGGLKQCMLSDLTIGGNDVDFVIENGKIQACLIVRDQVMEYIRVLLKNKGHEGIYHEQVQVTCDTDYEIKYGERTEEYERGDIVTIEKESEYGKHHKISVIPKALTGKTTLLSLERSQGNPAYRGRLEISPREEGFLIVNDVLVEEYLYSVLPSEMPPSYEKEALKAQAVCARSYAYRQMESSLCAEYGAHVDDSTSYQVYNNCEENPNTTAAIRETMGQVAMKNGKIMNTYYFSTSSGHTTDYGALDYDKTEGEDYIHGVYVGEGEGYADDTWTEESFEAYISQTDEKAYEREISWFRWTLDIYLEDLEGMEERLRERARREEDMILVKEGEEFKKGEMKELGEIQSMQILKRGKGGEVEELLVHGEKNTVKIIKEYNIRYALAFPGCTVTRQDNTEVKTPTLIPSAYFSMKAFDKEGKIGYHLLGGGYGHGVGMSQNGANEMAKRGMDSGMILQHFYQGIEIGEIYEDMDSANLSLIH